MRLLAFPTRDDTSVSRWGVLRLALTWLLDILMHPRCRKETDNQREGPNVDEASRDRSIVRDRTFDGHGRSGRGTVAQGCARLREHEVRAAKGGYCSDDDPSNPT